MSHDIVFLAAAVVFALTSLVFWLRLRRIEAKAKAVVESPKVPPDVAEAARDLSRQSVRLRSSLRRLAAADNPMEALINAINRKNGSQDGNDLR